MSMGPYEVSSLIGPPNCIYGSPDIYRVMPLELHQQNHTFLSELPPLPMVGPIPDPGVVFGPGGSNAMLSSMVGIGDTWMHQIDEYQLPCQQSQLLSVNGGDVADEEDSVGIRLVHVLVACAEAVQCGELPLAASLLDEIANGLLPRVGTTRGIGKVAGCFVEALTQRLFQPGPDLFWGQDGPGSEFEVLYHHFYEACPYLKFAHFTSNQAILEAFEGHDYVHVIDFSFIKGLQWPALIQALALRPGGPPSLRITGITGPLSGSGPESLREAGLKLAQLARSMNMRFSFRAVAAPQPEDIKPTLLETDPREALAVNSVLHLHRLLGSSSIEPVLNWIRNLNPKIVTIVEQEADHNRPEFLARFTVALYYYSALFDSLEAAFTSQPQKNLAEMYIQREITNIVSCEGPARVERHEPLAKWRARMGRAGFKPMYLSQNANKQATMLLTMFSSEGYDVEEREGCLSLGWHGRPLIVTSAWQVGPNVDSPCMTHEISSSSASSS